MAKVTSKYQVTLPKAIAQEYKIRPGDEIEWMAAGEVIRVVPVGQIAVFEDRDLRLHWFDQATERSAETRGATRKPAGQKPGMETRGPLQAWPLSLIPTFLFTALMTASPRSRK